MNLPNYNNYITTINIGRFGFNSHYPFPLMKDIVLSKIINKKFEIDGDVFDNNNNQSLENLYVKLNKENKFIESFLRFMTFGCPWIMWIKAFLSIWI